MLAQADADEVKHGLLHRDLDVLAAPCRMALVDCSEYGDGHMHSSAAVADRRPAIRRRSVREAGDAHGATHRLRNRLEALHVRVWAIGTEALDGCEDQARIDLLQVLPAETEPVQRA